MFFTPSQYSSVSLGLGIGSNNWAELSPFSALLRIAIEKGVSHLEVLGNSKLVIDGLNGKVVFQNVGLNDLMDQLLNIKSRFGLVCFKLIYQELNMDADHLSKDGAFRDAGWIKLQEYNDRVISEIPPSLFL